MAIDIIDLVLTAVAIFAGVYFGKRLAERRFIKEFIIADIHKLEDCLVTLEGLTNIDTISTATVFQNIHSLRMKTDVLCKTLDMAGINCNYVNDLISIQYTIYSDITNTDGDDIKMFEQKNNVLRNVENSVVVLRKVVCFVNKHV